MLQWTQNGLVALMTTVGQGMFDHTVYIAMPQSGMSSLLNQLTLWMPTCAGNEKQRLELEAILFDWKPRPHIYYRGLWLWANSEPESSWCVFYTLNAEILLWDKCWNGFNGTQIARANEASSSDSRRQNVHLGPGSSHGSPTFQSAFRKFASNLTNSFVYIKNRYFSSVNQLFQSISMPHSIPWALCTLS